MTNVGKVTDAIVPFLRIVKPAIYELLVDIYGERWWNVAVLANVGTKAGKKDLTKAKKKKQQFDCIDLYLLRKIIIGNRYYLSGKKPLKGHVFDDRFFDLVSQLNDLRNYGNAHFTEDISDVQRQNMINLLREIVYYIDDSECEVNGLLVKDGNGCLLSVPKVERSGSIIEECDCNDFMSSSDSKMSQSSNHVISNSYDVCGLDIMWTNEGIGLRYGCYKGGSRVSDDMVVVNGENVPIFDLSNYSGRVYKSYGNGDFYEGYVQSGLRNGIGMMVDARGNPYNIGLYYQDHFVGEILGGVGRFEDIVDGVKYDVVIRCKDGRYEGSIRDGAMNGLGIMRYITGESESGVFCNNEYLGDVVTFDDLSYDLSKLCDYSGKISITNNHLTYSGDWDRGIIEGHGKIICFNNYTYRGEFHNNLPNGKGIIDYANGDSFKGMFREGVIHGEGIYIFSDESTFEGSFLFGLKHGSGVFRRGGSCISGHWNHGSLEGDCSFIIDGKETIGCVDLGKCTIQGSSKTNADLFAFISSVGLIPIFTADSSEKTTKDSFIDHSYEIKYMKKISRPFAPPFGEWNINWGDISW